MESDTTDYTSTTGASSTKKPRKRNFFKCWKRDKDKESDEVIPKAAQPETKKSLADKVTMTEGSAGKTNTPRTRGTTDSDTKQNLNSKESKEKQQLRCPKCLKKKRDRGSIARRIDKRFCTCRGGGYCNTNTIIFPHDSKRGSVEAKEIHYLQLIKDIIKDETRKNLNNMTDFNREIDRQREEIKDLKNLLLQNLLGNKINEGHDLNNANKTGPTFPTSSSQSKITTPRIVDAQSRNAHKNKNVRKDQSDSSLVDVKSHPINTEEEKPFWNKLFNKK